MSQDTRDPFADLGEAAEAPMARPPAPRIQGEWSIAFGDELCGFCGKPFTDGDPIQLLTRFKKRRCTSCCVGEIDQAAVDAARAHREAVLAQAREADAAPPAPLPTPKRTRPDRPLKPISEIAGSFFDPRAAAANDRSDD